MRKVFIAAIVLCVSLMFAVSAFAAEKASPAAPAAATEKAPAAKAPKAELIDINSAAKEQLTTLPGITPELADKVMAGRPYKKKDQLKKIVGADVYKGIADKIIAKQPPKAK